MGGTFRIARIAGIDIAVHYTWLVAFFLITWSLAVGFFPQEYPGWNRPLYWITAVISALLLFGSVLIHELAHSFVALGRGLLVRSITLFIFGGVSSIKMEAEEAGDEFAISIVGPVTSLVLAGVFWSLGQLAPVRGVPAVVLSYLSFINVLLAVFNLLPGFPLDGGRVLRAVIWGATGDFARATKIAAGTGQVFAFLFIAWGVVQLFSGNFLGGLWTAFIGWFLNGAAEASRHEVATRESFRGVRVRDIMDTTPQTVTPDTSVADLVHEFILRRGTRAVPVCDDGRLVGIVSLSDVRDLGEPRWAATRVADVMTRDPLHSIAPTAEVADALRMLAEHQVHQALVVEGDRLVGLLTRAHLVEYLQFREELGLRV